MYPPRVIAVLACLVAGASLLSSGSPAAASEPRWSRNIIQNGDFSNGLDGWISADGFAGRPAAAAFVDGDPAARWTIGGTKCTLSGTKIGQRVEIDRQRVDHTFRFTLRIRVDGNIPGLAGVIVGVASEPREIAGAAGTYFGVGVTGSNVIFVEDRTPTKVTTTATYPVQEIASGEWRSVSYEFNGKTGPLGEHLAAVYFTVQPWFEVAPGSCPTTSSMRFAVDDVRVQFMLPEIQAASGAAYPEVDLAISDPRLRAADLLNRYRVAAGVGPVGLEPSSAGSTGHADYIVANKTAGHFETPGLPGYSAEGDQVARESNLCRTSSSFEPLATEATRCLFSLLTLPFHRLPLLSPWVRQVEIATAFSTTESGTVVRMRSSTATAATFPVLWPADRIRGVPTSAELASEKPNPLEACGLSRLLRTGYPVTARFSSSNVSDVRALLVDAGGASLETCVLDPRTPIPVDGDVYGPGITSTRISGVVVIPLRPLDRATAYTFTLSATVDGQAGTWTSQFVTEGDASALIASAVPKPVLTEKWAGALPASGVALASFRGGTAAEAASGMRQLHALSGGRFVSYVVGAPDFVNEAFLRLFPGGQIPAGTFLSVALDSE